MTSLAKGSTRLFRQLGKLTTEQRNPRSLALHRLPVQGVLKLINAEDAKVANAVRREIPRIAKAVALLVESLGLGGRLFYVGAGTSGRLGVLDAAECPPTFGTDPGMIRGIIAGGRGAAFRAVEGAEDRSADGRSAIRKAGAGKGDVVCGIAASLRTPYVGAALAEAKKRGARTLLITTNPRSVVRGASYAAIRRNVDVVISPDVGPEVLMGSTRMKSGTAQKMVLNMLTTTTMVALGKVYENMMVDLRLNSRKLGERARRVVMIATGADYAAASKLLAAAGGHVKTAIVMARAGTGAADARRRLRACGGFVHRAIAGKGPK